jgi:hypothetical protein
VCAVLVSLAVLTVTAVIQVLIFALSGSVALLADLIHNFGDALTAVPLGIALPDDVEVLPPVEQVRDRCIVARVAEEVSDPPPELTSDLLECLVCGAKYELDEEHPERLRCMRCAEAA